MPPNWSRFGMNWIAPARMPIYGLQADAEHTEREMARLKAALEQARRPWWWRLVGR
jgi:hypothetical protein